MIVAVLQTILYQILKQFLKFNFNLHRQNKQKKIAVKKTIVSYLYSRCVDRKAYVLLFLH